MRVPWPKLLVPLAILGIVIGIAVPAGRMIRDDGRVDGILATYQRLKRAVREHRRDTGTLATELSSSGPGSAADHELALPQTYLGWRGPYLDRPLGRADNPCGGFVLLYESLAGGDVRPAGSAFRLAGSGGDEVAGRGQFVAFGDVPAGLARRIDRVIDRGIPGDWRREGSVQYDAEQGRALLLFLLDG